LLSIQLFLCFLAQLPQDKNFSAHQTIQSLLGSLVVFEGGNLLAFLTPPVPALFWSKIQLALLLYRSIDAAAFSSQSWHYSARPQEGPLWQRLDYGLISILFWCVQMWAESNIGEGGKQ
jgi:hypothetical protein